MQSLLAAVLLAGSFPATGMAAKGKLDVTLLSSNPAYVSGGSALIQVGPAPAARPLAIYLNGLDVTDAFAPDPSRPAHLLGLVTGLNEGPNELVATFAGRSASLEITNYPITGPIISGPHQEPFICQTHQFQLPDGTLLGSAMDDDCSITPMTNYLYLPAGGTALVPMPDTTQLPADIASTRTTEGVTMPFAVRVETRTVNRGIYQSAVLHDPTAEQAPTPFTPPRGWNGRLLAVQGFGCPGGWYIQGASQGSLGGFAGMDFTLLSVNRLGEGYATHANTLQHASNNCNHVLASEAAMMSKEQFIKIHGVPALTVSAGCSGGSYGSALPADRIPGLYDGIMLACTYPDPLSIALSASDGRLLENYWNSPGNPAFSADQIIAITGNKTVQAHLDLAVQSRRADPVPQRSNDIPGYPLNAHWNQVVPFDLRYDPDTNPTGARPTVYDGARNIYGVDEDGYALRAFDNVGVQYGLAALNDGTITVDQFLDMNESVGGVDRDANFISERSMGDPGAMRRAQESGLQLGGNGGLTDIPVFDITGIYNDDGGYHYQWFHWAVRERMLKANGHTDNHVMWRGNPVPFDTAWATFMQWVADYKADPARVSQLKKILRNKPDSAVDGCWSDPTTFIAETQVVGTSGSQCNELLPSWTFTRHEAGGPLAANILKCGLKPLSQNDYNMPFTASQWQRLQDTFPHGVCDWSQDGNYTGVVPNGSFGPSPINLVHDITAP